MEVRNRAASRRVALSWKLAPIRFPVRVVVPACGLVQSSVDAAEQKLDRCLAARGLALEVRMPFLGNALSNSLAAPPPVAERGARVKFRTRGNDLSEAGGEGDAQRRRITFIGQTKESVPRFCEAASSTARPHSHHAEAVPELSYELPGLGSVTATITGRVCRMLVEHCKESNFHGREVGGMLVGHCGQREIAGAAVTGPEYELVLTDAIPICSFNNSRDHLSVTEEAWARAEEELRKKYAPQGKVRLGWYHTHPDQGIFFSGKDRTAHRIF